MPACCICGELATHNCHVKDRTEFDSGEDDRYRNIIVLCQTHHGVYFDNHYGRKRRFTHMIINLHSNELWIIDPRIKAPKNKDIKSYTYEPLFDLNPEYVRWKNRRALPILRTELRKYQREII